MTTNSQTVIIWGAGGHAKVLNELFSRVGCEVAALFDNDPQSLPPLDGIPLFHGAQGFAKWYTKQTPEVLGTMRGAVAIGGGKGRDRLDRQRFLQSQGIAPLLIVHPTSFVAMDARLGLGTQVLARACVCTSAQLEEACIVNTAASVDHECVLGNGVHIAPGATLTGCIEVEDYAFVGAGAVVLPRLRIGRNAVVGAGAVVTRDVPPDTVVVGNPARARSAQIKQW